MSLTSPSRLPDSVTTHPDYEFAILPLKMVRDCVDGGYKIKRLAQEYLPHPSQVNPEDEAQQVRYQAYLRGAEFDEYTQKTLKSWLGKMRIKDATVEVPDRIEYLVRNADGDGTDIRASAELTASNIFQARYHVLVADYQGLSDVKLTEVSRADAAQLNPRATIKQYPRENLVNWHYRRINGVMQLAFVMLREIGSDFNIANYSHDPIESYLILALDDDGEYYQQKIVNGPDGIIEGNPDYVTVNGQSLNWLPVEIVADDELPSGHLPTSMGMLYPIADLCISRYNRSAPYGEAMAYMVATSFTKGWQPGDLELFKELNGRENILFGPGASNNLPENVSFEIQAVNTELGGFERYFDANEKKIRQMGGSVQDPSGGNATATEAQIDAVDINAMFQTLADSVERAYRRMISYCAMFEGVWSPADVEIKLDEVVFSLPRDFATPKLSVEEVRMMLDLYAEGIYTKKQLIELLQAGGWGDRDIDTWITELDEASPNISGMAELMARIGATNNAEVQEDE